MIVTVKSAMLSVREVDVRRAHPVAATLLTQQI